jgi:hypothetical protein
MMQHYLRSHWNYRNPCPPMLLLSTFQAKGTEIALHYNKILLMRKST